MTTARRERPAETGAPIIEVRAISKIYEGGVEALNDISLEVPRGKLTTLLGPSGCGKTTLLKIIAGLIPATSGEVLVSGRPVTGPGPDRAFVFQDFALMPWASVLRNVAFGLELRGVAQAEREGIAHAAISGKSAWPASRIAIRTSFPAACASASVSPARSRSTPTCC